MIQDSIDKPDIKAVLKKVSDDNYDSYFQKPVASTEIVAKVRNSKLKLHP